MGKPSAFYLVYDDEKGSFVNINKIQTVTPIENDDGAVITLKDGTILYSPLKPRQILYKIRTIKHNLKVEADARKVGAKGKLGTSKQQKPPDEVD